MNLGDKFDPSILVCNRQTNLRDELEDSLFIRGTEYRIMKSYPVGRQFCVVTRCDRTRRWKAWGRIGSSAPLCRICCLVLERNKTVGRPGASVDKE